MKISSISQVHIHFITPNLLACRSYISSTLTWSINVYSRHCKCCKWSFSSLCRTYHANCAFSSVGKFVALLVWMDEAKILKATTVHHKKKVVCRWRKKKREKVFCCLVPKIKQKWEAQEEELEEKRAVWRCSARTINLITLIFFLQLVNVFKPCLALAKSPVQNKKKHASHL